jgi:hypothetical protein
MTLGQASRGAPRKNCGRGWVSAIATREEALLSSMRVLAIWMEKKSGFKECPRCGLRNKLASVQCDFCGWEFHEASDEWNAHVKALDRMSHDVDSVVLDDELSKKIESTIVRGPREMPPSKPELTVEEIVTVEQEAELRTGGEMWSAGRMAQAELPSAEMHEVKVLVDTMIGEAAPRAVATAASLDPPAMIAEIPAGELRTDRVIEAKVRRNFGLELRNGVGAPLSLMGAGAVVYGIALTGYSWKAMDLYAGWAIAVFGALALTFGLYWFGRRRSTEKADCEEPVIGVMDGASNEVIICPQCNELVNESVVSCPSCGARFDRQ